MSKLSLSALLILFATGCQSPSPADGTLKCSAGTNKCPHGYHCASGACWKNGNDPIAAQAAHEGTPVMSGGVTAKSAHYKVIMSTGQPPQGRANAASGSVNKAGASAGATQGTK